MIGDGIRRNIATVSQQERDLFIDAIKKLNQAPFVYPGARTDFPAGGVTYWFKQDEVHQASHVHGCPQFLPWHREFCNRFEALLRMVHPELSLHYWDWNLDPANLLDADGNPLDLFSANFMGNADPNVNGGAVGNPLQSAGFYNPTAANYRDDISPKRLNRPNPNDPSTFSYGANGNPADPPRTLIRGKLAGAPPVGQWLRDPFNGDWTVVPPGTAGALYWASDSDLINAPSWSAFQDLMAGVELNTSQNATHALAHQYIGGANGNLSDPHLSFRDPFVFLLHSNLDRLWAMWQRQNGAVRLDPAQVYGADENTQGSGDVEFGDPNWGILSPLEPWSGYSAQTAATGIISNLWPIRPWFPPENQQAYKDAKDLTVVIPPSYDTAVHSSYVIANQDTFSSTAAAVNPTFSRALYVVYDGFQPREVGTPTVTNPSFTFSIGGATVTSIKALNPQVFLEDPAGAPDVPQRISIACDIVFTDMTVFPATSGAESVVTMQVTLNYTVGGTAVAATDRTTAILLLVNQPSPYMVDIDPLIPPPGPPNPYWLSTDTRVLKVVQGAGIAGITQQPGDPFGFIKDLVGHFNSLPNDNNHPFLQLPQDENASQLELAPTFGGTPVFNYAVAKIRYVGNVPANNVSVFFRAFKTVVSSLQYDQTSATSTTGNYRRSGNSPGSVPLLGLESNEIASIPFFASQRVDTGASSMTMQTDDPINTQINFVGNGQEEVVYCGVWLDINDTMHQRFPLNPAADPGGVNGPYQNQKYTIQQLLTGLHYCLVAEIFFWPPGVTTDPIPIGATPASNDRLAQRNLSFDSSGNPGWPSTHTVACTFLVKPSIIIDEAVQEREKGRFGLDELMVQWGNVPRGTNATFYFPEVTADEILALSQLRQHPAVISKVDANTISVRIADVTYIPLPARQSGNLAGLLTLVLPAGVRVGQAFRMNIQQYSGNAQPRRAFMMLGAFEFDIPVSRDEDILPRAERNLSILRYIQQTIPQTNRWYPIFVRWLNSLAAKVAGLGGNPAKIPPSPTGGDHPPEPCREPEVCEAKPRDLWALRIPWEECEIEGELELKIRFRKKHS
jgi:hypothetical protein